MTWLAIFLLIAAILWFFGNYNLWRPVRPDHWPRILMYHSLDEAPESGMNIRPDHFEKQLRQLLAGGYQPCLLPDLCSGRFERPLALTFDDGFANNYHQLFPILQRLNLPATIFLAPDIAEIEALNPEQIREMADTGLIEFGAHSLDHVNLTRLDDAEARRQIEESVDRVAKLSGRPCRVFSYPFGRYQPRHVEMVRATGCSHAVTVRKAFAPCGGDSLELPRVGVNGRADRLQFHILLSRGRYKL